MTSDVSHKKKEKEGMFQSYFDMNACLFGKVSNAVLLHVGLMAGFFAYF